ncbi:hypothetical protein FM036_38385 [Nostoc sp. HG1]|nr:hypothetical protein [Nostoc sp. HG1]
MTISLKCLNIWTFFCLWVLAIALARVLNLLLAGAIPQAGYHPPGLHQKYSVRLLNPPIDWGESDRFLSIPDRHECHLIRPIAVKSIARNSCQFPIRSWRQKPGFLRKSLVKRHRFSLLPQPDPKSVGFLSTNPVSSCCECVHRQENPKPVKLGAIKLGCI